MKKMMKRIMGFLMLSCKKATELIEKRQVKPLSAIEKIQLDAHLSMCKACHAYEDQSVQIDQLWEKQIASFKDEVILTDKEKTTLIEFLKKNI